MTSRKQVEANRRNAKKSSGPKSARGKQIARRNSVQHGLRAEHVVFTAEDAEEFEALLRGLREDYQPVGSREVLLVERIAQYTWRLRMSGLIETNMFRKGHLLLKKELALDQLKNAQREMDDVQRIFAIGQDEVRESAEDSDDDHNLPDEKAKSLMCIYERAEEVYENAIKDYERAEHELENPRSLLDVVFLRTDGFLERLSRYETTNEKRLRNATQDLERLQSARKDKATETATVIDVTDQDEEPA